jgi:hypothetical protein
MIHNEHFDKADRTYEVRHDNNGAAIHVLIKDGEAIIYPTLHDLYLHFNSGVQVERMYVSEEDLGDIYELDVYDYYRIKKAINYNNL